MNIFPWHRLHAAVSNLRGSLWFVPTVILVGNIALAVGLVELSAGLGNRYVADWPRLLGASAESAQGMLSAIATSMVTVAGVVFSITIVSLSLASTQYSPRVLSSFMSDRLTQGVLGVFVGIFAYCLVVIRTIRSPQDGQGGFVPSLAVLGGVGLALLGVAVLIYFIHHVASSIRVSSILQRLGDETEAAIDRLFPAGVGRPPAESDGAVAMPDRWTPVPAWRSGYLPTVKAPALLDFAIDTGRVVRLAHAVGEFVVEGQPLAHLSGDAALPPSDLQRFEALLTLGPSRTLEQDAGYGLQQLQDIALRALSAGINDPTTACMAIQHLSRIWVRLADRPVPSPLRFAQGQLRAIVPRPGFDDLFLGGFEPIVGDIKGSALVWESLLRAVETLLPALKHDDRRSTVLAALDSLRRHVAAQVTSPEPRRRLLARAAELRRTGR